MIEFFGFGSKDKKEPQPTDLGRRRAMQVAAGGAVVAGTVISETKDAIAQILGTNEKLALAGSVNLTDFLDSKIDKPQQNIALYEQIVRELSDAAPYSDPNAAHAGRLIFIKGEGRSAIFVHGRPSTKDGQYFLRNMTAYIQIADGPRGEKRMIKMETFDLENPPIVEFELAVVGQATDVPNDIIYSGKQENSSELFNRVMAMFSQRTTTAISTAMNSRNGSITTCLAVEPITTIPEEIKKLGAAETRSEGITHVGFADSPRSPFAKDIKSEAALVAMKLWQGLGRYFAPGS